jgi:hypothetical protein
MRDFYSLSQGKHRNNQEYYNDFNSLVLTAEESGTTIGAHPAGVTEILNKSAIDPANPTNDERTAAIKSAVERYLAVTFLLGADRIRYGTLVEEIENEFLRSKGSLSTAGTYPTSVSSEAYDYLCIYRKDPKNLARLLGHNIGNKHLKTAVAFVQENQKTDAYPNSQEQTFMTTGDGDNNNNHMKVCRRCGADGHP